MKAALRAGNITFGFLLALFCLHRILTFQYLASIALQPNPPLKTLLDAIAVGSMSDFWVAGCGAFIVVILTVVFTLFAANSSTQRKRIPPLVACLFIAIWGLLLGIHQGYVEFFRHQIIPFHLSYLTDFSFLSANTATGFNIRSTATYLLTVVFAWLAFRVSTPATKATFQHAAITGMILVTSLAAHTFNIKYRVQWFVPEQLQMNMVEKFFATMTRTRPVQKLTVADLKSLSIGYPDDILEKIADPSAPALTSRIVMQSMETPPSPVESALAHKINERLSAGEKILALTILMESFRPSEIGAYTNYSPSITPHFDALSKSGILFLRAYATGGVTRTGQEAAWCGYLGGQETSTMRGREDVQIVCLPQVVREKFGTNVSSVWFHGGDGGFDGQKNYWLRQGVDKIITRDDYPATAARTGWGIGDITVFKNFSSRTLEAPLSFGMLLSVSNHIPWTMPLDAPDDEEFAATVKSVSGRHDAFATTAYSDFALGNLVSDLKQSGQWKNTILVISSDHGTLEETLAATPAARAAGDDAEKIAAENLSHIALLVAGGLVESVVGESQKQELAESDSLDLERASTGANQVDNGVTGPTPSRVVSRVVSQAGIAAFWTNTLGLEYRTMMPSIFAEPKYPVFADLGHAIYLPKTQRILAKESVSAEKLPEEYSEEDRRAILYYRAFVHFINSIKPVPGKEHEREN